MSHEKDSNLPEVDRAILRSSKTIEQYTIASALLQPGEIAKLEKLLASSQPSPELRESDLAVPHEAEN